MSAGRTLGLLVCGHVPPDALDLGGDYPALFGSLLEPLGVEVVAFDAVAGHLPASIDDCEGWLTSPARESVIDDHPWIHALGDLVRELVARERPFAGMCFGHQLLASALGGRVERSPHGWGAGAKTYELVARRRWMDPPLDRVRLVASHEDQVVELPPGAALLARADYCPIAAFELGERAIGIQPHPEFSADISRRLTTLRYDLMGAATSDAALASLGLPLDRATVARWLVTFLLGRPSTVRN